MGASLRPWLGPLPAWQVYPALLLTTDANWIVAHALSRRRRRRCLDLSPAPASRCGRCGSRPSIPGYLLGAVMHDPKRFGIDLMLPIFFAAMLVQLWRGPRRAIGWAVAGVVALVTAQLHARLLVHRRRRGRRQHRRRLRR